VLARKNLSICKHKTHPGVGSLTGSLTIVCVKSLAFANLGKTCNLLWNKAEEQIFIKLKKTVVFSRPLSKSQKGLLYISWNTPCSRSFSQGFRKLVYTLKRYIRLKIVPGYVDCEEGKPAEHKAPNNDADRLCCFCLHFELSHLERVPALDCNLYFFKSKFMTVSFVKAKMDSTLTEE
jgi:hypothetical protein